MHSTVTRACAEDFESNPGPPKTRQATLSTAGEVVPELTPPSLADVLKEVQQMRGDLSLFSVRIDKQVTDINY